MVDPEVCEVATKAIEILNTDGWTQNAYHSRNGSHCLMGAIEKATGYWLGPDGGGGYGWDTSKAEIYSKVNTALWSTINRSPVTFNDNPKTTKQDVINLLAELCG